MKKFKLTFTILIAFTLLSACGIARSNNQNVNNHVTNVELNRNNYKIIEEVRGEASAVYVFGLGGMTGRALIEQAKADMLKNANLTGSRALINMTTETYNVIAVVYNKRTVIVRAHVIEFTD